MIDRGSIYSVLHGLPPSQALKATPTGFWSIFALEIAISIDQIPALLLTLPSYELDRSGPASLAVCRPPWTAPFAGFPVDPGYSSPDTVGGVRALFEEAERKLDGRKEIEKLCYLLGLPDPTFVAAGSIIELKPSPRTPSQVKVYKINRYILTRLGARGRLNLADPEFRKGHAFLPIEAAQESVRVRSCPAHLIDEWIYLGRPLVSNLRMVLSDPAEAQRLMSTAISLGNDDLAPEAEGVIIHCDVVRYGTAERHAREFMRSFAQEPSRIAQDFRDRVNDALLRFLHQVGVYQCRLTGDGFVAAIPMSQVHGRCRADVVSDLLEGYQDLKAKLKRLSDSIEDASSHVGSRLALTYGSYRYGRLGGVYAHGPSLDGLTMIEAARLDAAASRYIKSKSGRTAHDGAVPHVVIASPAISDDVSKAKAARNWVRVSLKVREKEYRSPASLWVTSTQAERG